MPTKVILHDPILSEYVYDFIHLCSEENKKKLNAAQLRAIKNPKSVKRFAVKSTMDEKLAMLSKLGASFALMIFPTGLFSKKSIKDLFTKYNHEKIKDRVDAILQDKVMAITDRQITLISQLMANTAHSDSYLLSRDFHKIGQHILNWEEPENALTEASLENLEYLNVISKVIFNSIMGSKHLTVNKVNNDLDINILLHLLLKRNRYVAKSEIDTIFRPYYKIATITSAVKRLMENVYIDSNPSSKTREYIITSLGIEEAMSFIKKTMNQTLNF
jgi:hypothetical protein